MNKNTDKNHFAAIDTLRGIAFLVLSIPVAYGFYLIFENPSIELTHKFKLRKI